MAQVSITLGKGSVISLEDNNTIHVKAESYGHTDTSVYLCNATKKDVSAVQDYLERLKVFLPDQ